VDAVVPHREDTHDPLHDPREALTLPWYDQEMKMVAHDAEILYPEFVFLLCPLDDGKEQLLLGL